MSTQTVAATKTESKKELAAVYFVKDMNCLGAHVGQVSTTMQDIKLELCTTPVIHVKATRGTSEEWILAAGIAKLVWK